MLSPRRPSSPEPSMSSLAAVRPPRSTPDVCHVFGVLNRGGAELRTLEVMEHLAAQGRLGRHDVIVLSGQRGELDDRWTRLGGQIHYWPIKSQPWRLPLLPLRLRSLSPRVLHSHVALFSGVLVAAARLARIPRRVAHFRSSGIPINRPRYVAFLRRCLRWGATDFLAVSQAALDGSLGAAWGPEPRAQVAYNGLDPARFAAAPDVRARVRAEMGTPLDAPVVITVARLDVQKQHERLVPVMAQLLAEQPTLEWWIAGRNDTAHATQVVRPQVDALPAGLQARIRWLGVRADVPDLLAAADCNAFPTALEGLPGTTLEALASGLRVVATDIAPHQEIAAHLPLQLCSTRIVVAEWVSAIRAALADQTPAGRAAMQAQFARSPFTITAAAETLSRRWPMFGDFSSF